MKNHASLASISDSFFIDSANQPRKQGGQSEDYVLVHSELLGVFDSVGGRDHGQLVSHLAGRVIASAWQSLPEVERQGTPEQIELALQAMIRMADARIAALDIPAGQRRPATVAALCVLSLQPQNQAFLTVAHVGDSRVYLQRAGQQLQRLTQDNGYFPFAIHHGLAEEDAWRIEQAEQAEALSPDERQHFSRRHEITCAVGWTDFQCVQTNSLPLVRGDRILLCSDGVHDNFTDREIEEVLESSGEASAQRLVCLAYHRSQQRHFRAKQDDISAIVAWYRGSC